MAQRSEYYGGYKSKSERQSIAWIVTKIIFFGVALLFSVALALTLLTPVVRPSVWGVMPMLGVAAPVVYIVNFAMAMVLIIRWKLKAALPLIVLLIAGGGKISRYAKMDFSTHYDTPSYKGSSKILSYNLRMHYGDDNEWTTPQLIEYFNYSKADILCLQEFNSREFDKHLTGRLKKYNSHIEEELAIFSRYPIIARSEYILLGEEQNAGNSRAIWVDLKISNDTVRVFCNHLTSTMINKSDDKFLSSSKFISDSMREYKFKDIVYRFSHSSAVRSSHADSIAMVIAQSPHRVVVCGDFNDTPMSYAYNTIARGLKDSFVECGTGYPYTYRGFMNLLRIDFILASPDITFKSYSVDTDIKLSDHNPIVSHFSINKQ